MTTEFVPAPVSTNGHSNGSAHLHVHHHLPRAAAFSIRELKAEVRRVEGFNAKFAVGVTGAVGSMACAYLFSCIAFLSLPAVLVSAGFVSRGAFPSWLIQAGLIALVAWVAQTFLQLILLSVIMVGQQVQSAASDARAEQTYQDTVEILDRLNLETQGGITEILQEVKALHAKLD